MTPEDVESFERCISSGGLAIFPADTVYALGTVPTSAEGVDRLYSLKGRSPDKPAAVMFFQLDSALAALPELGQRTREAVERLLPGGVTLVLPNPARRFPLACGPDPKRVGVRVPLLEGELEPLSVVGWPVLQSSANMSGESDARRVSEVDQRVRAGVDVVLDGGELPGTPSTVIDLSKYEDEGAWSVIREGAIPREAVVRSLR